MTEKDTRWVFIRAVFANNLNFLMLYSAPWEHTIVYSYSLNYLNFCQSSLHKKLQNYIHTFTARTHSDERYTFYNFPICPGFWAKTIKDIFPVFCDPSLIKHTFWRRASTIPKAKSQKDQSPEKAKIQKGQNSESLMLSTY